MSPLPTLTALLLFLSIFSEEIVGVEAESLWEPSSNMWSVHSHIDLHSSSIEPRHILTINKHVFPEHVQ